LTALYAVSQVSGLTGVSKGAACGSKPDALVSRSVVPGKKNPGYSLRNDITSTEWPRVVSSRLR
jgi:hypothetical protein